MITVEVLEPGAKEKRVRGMRKGNAGEVRR